MDDIESDSKLTEADLYSLDDAIWVLHKAGAKVIDPASKKTYYVVVVEEAGSKLDKAKQLGIELWDEKKLLSIINKKK